MLSKNRKAMYWVINLDSNLTTSIGKDDIGHYWGSILDEDDEGFANQTKKINSVIYYIIFYYIFYILLYIYHNNLITPLMEKINIEKMHKNIIIFYFNISIEKKI
jgi:hypothetical protein